jgi:hypothetical protein
MNDPKDLSDDEWLAQLAGRSAASDHDAAALARVFKAHHASQQARSDAHEQLRLEQLLFRLRKEKLLESSPKRLVTASNSAWFALAASVVAAVLLFGPLQNESDHVYYPEPPTMRGTSDADVRSSADPRAAAMKLAAGLKTAGVKSNIYQDKADFYVDYAIAPERYDSLENTLVTLGLPKKVGQHRVQFKKS